MGVEHQSVSKGRNESSGSAQEPIYGKTHKNVSARYIIYNGGNYI